MMKARGHCPRCHADLALAGGPKKNRTTAADGEPRRPQIGDHQAVTNIPCPGAGSHVAPYIAPPVEATA